ncbi:hypothetical protein NDU88_005864 [Pleurodeles waltl]|uniref:Uncharacterized protein n=1 Tax=Pleurodeles waltl TaxID=8319 RepID=A0AAV7PJ83_PLEWA|nr:hypothetical protein NDU88_005864 [Pleurodeles waltl]
MLGEYGLAVGVALLPPPSFSLGKIRAALKNKYGGCCLADVVALRSVTCGWSPRVGLARAVTVLAPGEVA